MASKTYKLNTGYQIPAVGLGTWQSDPGQVTAAVLAALKAGYRHIDAAYVYGNETEVGAALAEAFSSGLVKREDIFVTTKLWCTFHTRVQEGLEASLKNLGLDYVDLYLMHWPIAMNPNGNHPNLPKLPDGSRDILWDHSHTTTWKSLEALPSTGKVRSIGVANYSVPFLKEILADAKIVPAANQVENHPLLPQTELLDFCREKGIHVTAYSPLGSTGSPLMQLESVKKVAGKHGVGEGTVLISWAVARGNSVVPKSVTPARIEKNLQIIELDKDDLATLDTVSKEEGIKRYIYPAFGVDLKFPDKSA